MRAQELVKAGAGAVGLQVEAMLYIPEKLVVREIRETPTQRTLDGSRETAVEIEVASNTAFSLQVVIEPTDTTMLAGLEILDAWGAWQVVRPGLPVVVRRQSDATNGTWVSARLRHPAADPRPLLGKLRFLLARLN